MSQNGFVAHSKPVEGDAAAGLLAGVGARRLPLVEVGPSDRRAPGRPVAHPKSRRKTACIQHLRRRPPRVERLTTVARPPERPPNRQEKRPRRPMPDQPPTLRVPPGT